MKIQLDGYLWRVAKMDFNLSSGVNRVNATFMTEDQEGTKDRDTFLGKMVTFIKEQAG